MRGIEAGAVAGLVGAAVMGLVMVLGRRSGVLHKTLGEESEDWLDRNFQTRSLIGDEGTTLLEQANHMAAGAAFGVAYEVARPAFGNMPAAASGALYGAGLYLLNIAGLAPLLGITRGERNAPAPVVAQRLGTHVLFGVVTALALEGLSGRRP